MTLPDQHEVLPFSPASGPDSSRAAQKGAAGFEDGTLLEFAGTDGPETRDVSVLVVAPDESLRVAMSDILASAAHAEVLATTADPIQAVLLTESLLPEVAIVEVDEGHEQLWLRTASAIRAASPETGIVIVATDRETEYVEYKVDRNAGGWSYLLRENAVDGHALMRAVGSAAWGLVTVDPAVRGSQATEGVFLHGLAEEEHQVLRLMALGYNDRAIQTRTGISSRVLDERLEAIYDRLDIEVNETVDRRVRAVMTYHLASRLV